MFNFLKKNKEAEQLPAQQNKLAPANIKVADIKQYLVNEYENVKKLEYRIQCQNDAIEKAKDLKLEYDAALVTLSEYKERLDRREKEIYNLERKLKEKDARIYSINEDLNTHKIMLRNKDTDHEKDRNDLKVASSKFRKEGISTLSEELLGIIENFKGPLSKQKAIEMINTSVKGLQKWQNGI